jgi:hypothetical protein
MGIYRGIEPAIRHPIMASVVLMSGFVCLVLACLGVGSSTNPPTPRETKPTSAARTSDNETSAKIMSEDFVTSYLKSPSTADFPWKAESVIREGTGWRVNSYVDSQNSFGAMIRLHYTCVVENIDGDSWKCTSLVIDGEQLR